MSSRHSITEGVLCALGAGLVWGLVFVAPLMLAEYPPALLAFGDGVAGGHGPQCAADRRLVRTQSTP